METPNATADVERFSFTERGPWVVDPDRMPWRRSIDELRTATRREGAELARPPSAPPVGRMLWTGAQLGQAVALWQLLDRREGGASSRAAISRRLRKAFERLGPTYIKLGQIVSAGEGIFPPELVAEFRLCRDEVKAETWEDVRRVVEEDLRRPLDQVFSEFVTAPVAAASIAQVHVAKLRTGEDVVVKVQRPRVAESVRQDLRAMSWIAPKMIGRIPVAALANPPAIVELFADTIVEELDFRLEAQNMLDIAQVLAETGQRSVIVPRPHPELITPRVLVMERLHGHNFDDVEAIKRAGVDMKAVIRAGMVTTLEGAMLYGVFHGDLHAGNMFVDDSGRVALLDFGIAGRLDENRRLAFVRLLMGGVTNDVKAQLAAARDMGALPSDTDLDAVIAELGLDRPPVDPTKLTAEQLVGEIRDIVRKLVEFGARLPKELMLFVKNLLFLDGAIAMHAPDLDLIAETFQVASYFATKHGERLAAETGTETDVEINLEGFKASFGLDASVESLTYEELLERRRIIRERFEEHRGTRRRRRRS
ncbi:MAG: ABC1 kinase family protein [Actinomycetota bacterium]